jgi:hypothetical protein
MTPTDIGDVLPTIDTSGYILQQPLEYVKRSSAAAYRCPFLEI